MDINHILLLLMTAASTVFLFSAAILWKGGWSRKEDTVPSTRLQKTISITFALSGLNILLYAILGSIPDSSALWMDCLDWMSFLPLSLLLLQANLLRQSRNNWKQVLIATWPLIAELPLVFIFSGQNILILRIAHGLVHFYIFALYIIALRKLRKWDCQMLDEYSDIAHKQTVWFRKLTLPFMLLALLWAPMALFPESQWILILYYGVIVLLTVKISEHALKQEEFDYSEVEQSALETENAPAAQEPGNERYAFLAPKLEHLMNEEKIYCKPDLTITFLAQEIGVNRTYLSRYINAATGGTFYDYINSYRLREAQKYLIETDLPVSAIAKMSGFASLATFSRYFRSAHNQTPSDYRLHHKA